jgi:hypothetical protein
MVKQELKQDSLGLGAVDEGWRGSMTELVGRGLRSKQAGSGTGDSGTGGVTGGVEVLEGQCQCHPRVRERRFPRDNDGVGEFRDTSTGRGVTMRKTAW